MPRLAFTPPIFLSALLPPPSRVPSIISRMSSAPPSSQEERFDILRADGTLAGFSKPRTQVHRDGDWHRSTHIWVLSTDGQLLVQKRSALKDTFPGRWDVSAAGHVSAGGGSLECAQRELAEELGVQLDSGERLELIGTERAQARGWTERYGRFVDNEVQDVYVYRGRRTVGVEEMVLQEEEVDKVEYWEWREYRRRVVAGDDEGVVPRSKEYCEMLFPWLEKEVG